MLGEIPDERLQCLLVKPMRHPIERWAKVVHKLLPRKRRSDVASKPSSFLDTRVARLHPDEIRIGTKGNGSLRRSGYAGFVVVMTFPGPGDVPGEENWFLAVLRRHFPPAAEWHVTFFADD